MSFSAEAIGGFDDARAHAQCRVEQRDVGHGHSLPAVSDTAPAQTWPARDNRGFVGLDASTPPRATLARVTSILELLASKTVQELATPANARLGRELADGDEVQILEVDSHRVEARVGGSQTQRRRIELRAATDRLEWSCTCTTDPKLFCKHLAAAALAVGIA